MERDSHQFIMIKREKNLVRLKLEIASLIKDLKYLTMTMETIKKQSNMPMAKKFEKNYFFERFIVASQLSLKLRSHYAIQNYYK
jgi:hypothetical protein